jgi:hypothetical protein
MNKSNNIYDSVVIGATKSKAKVYGQSLMHSGDAFQIGTAFSSCDKVIIDIKAIASARYSNNSNSSKESVRYYLNESNPFDVVIDYQNPIKSPSYIKGLISYNKSKNIVEINTGVIFDKGFFPFNLKLNFTSDGITRGKITKQKPVIKIETDDKAKVFFDGLQVRVDKSDNASKNALIIDETKRFSQSNLFNFSSASNNFGQENINVSYSGSGDFSFDENVNLKSVLIKNTAQVYVPYGFPIVSIYDRHEEPRMRNGVIYANNNPKMHTAIDHTAYITSQGVPFYDQVVRRTLMGEEDTPRDHPLVSISDAFGTVQAHEEIPIVHFRREYCEIENKDNGKAPYHLYFCPSYVRKSDNIVDAISIELHKSVSQRVTLQIGVRQRSLNKFSLESKTTAYFNGSLRVFYGKLDIEVPSDGSFMYGKGKVFHSDNDDDSTLFDCNYGISVMDVLKILQSNIAGNVNVNSSFGTSSPTHVGFIPTFEEIGFLSNNPKSPIAQFYPGKSYRACALIAAARLWNGNTDSSSSNAREEREWISLEGKNFRENIKCRGLSHNVDLGNFLGVAPLCRALTTAYVRGEIKSFEKHLEDGDFIPIELGGPGYNKFYKYDTLRKSIDVMSFGESYFRSIINLNEFEVQNMTCPGPATKLMYKGQSRRLIGGSQIGVAFDYAGDTFDSGYGGFFENTPAYFMSHIGVGNISSTRRNSFVKRISDMSNSSIGISIHYKHSAMFPGPYSYKDRIYVPSPLKYFINEYGEDPKSYYNGGIFHVLYSTSGRGSHVSGISDIKVDGAVSNATSLNPFNFDGNALVICEGGDESSSLKRRVVIDSRMSWLENAPERDNMLCAFLLKEMTDWARLRGWVPGKTVKFNFDSRSQENYKGTVSITGSGSKQILAVTEYDVESGSVSYYTNTGESKFIDKSINSFVDSHKKTFENIVNVEVSAVIDGFSNLPYEDLVFDRIVLNKDPEKPISDLPEIEPYNPYYYSDQLNSALQAGSYEVIDQNYGQEMFASLYSPYYEDNPYFINPYVPDVESTRGVYGIYSRTKVSELKGGLRFKIDFINRNIHPRSYYFYLNNPRYSSVQDIVDDINNRLSDFGITAKSMVSNPKAYSVQRISGKDNSTIVNAEYNFERIEKYQIINLDEPYSTISPDIDAYSFPYLASASNVQSQALSFENFTQEQISFVSSSNEYYEYSEYYYSDFIPGSVINGPSNNPSIVGKNVTPTITYERVRTAENSDADININYDLYDQQYSQPESLSFNFIGRSTNFSIASNNDVIMGRPRDVAGVKDMEVKESIINTEEFDEDSRYVTSDEFIDQNYNNRSSLSYRLAAQQSPASPPNIKAIEIAYGGEIKNGSISYNRSPNTYFSNSEQTGIGEIQFRTIDADYAIILVRISYQDGSYGPNNAAADNIFSSIKANVYYNNGKDFEQVLGELSPTETFESISYFNQNNEEIESLLVPIAIKIPLKSTVNYVSIFMTDSTLAATVKIVNAPSELNNFGFLAINKNNPNYDMGSSKDGRTFGLVLDNYGFWDILIAPEAMLSSVAQGEFSFNGRGYSRTPIDTDDRFVAGVGSPILDSINNDINGFDKSMIPVQIRNAITIIPVPGYHQVWVLRIDPAVKSYLISRRKALGSISQDGCFVDVPIYFQSLTTEASGTCNVRIFNNVSCVFDYSFCDFFWNLGAPLQPPAPFVIQDSIEVDFTEYISCDEVARRIDDNGVAKVEVTSYCMMNINKIPMLDSGSALMLIKTDLSESSITEIFNPTIQTLLKLKTKNNVDSEFPWIFDCSSVDSSASLNRTVLYTNPQNYNQYISSPGEIASSINSLDRFLLVQPKFKFPAYDENGTSSDKEIVIASIGFIYKNWRPAFTDFWKERMMFGIKFVIPEGQAQTNLSQNFSIRFLYNEDRKLL